MDPSPSVEKEVKHQIDLLNRFYDRISGCDVRIEAPHRHHSAGWKFKVTIKIIVPGDTIMVSHGHENSPDHEDCHLTVRDAFRSARRQVQDYARIRRHDVKIHNPAAKRELRQQLSEIDDK